MNYIDVVKQAQTEIKSRSYEEYRNKKIIYKPCDVWLSGNEINLWTYWQGWRLKDIDQSGVDILLVGQDWGNPWIEKNKTIIDAIREMQEGNYKVQYPCFSHTNITLQKMFKVFGVDIFDPEPGMRLFFTNYSLGYRFGPETGGMTKGLLLKDRHLFENLVEAIKPKIIICLGRLTFEVVAGKTEADFLKKLKTGEPCRSYYYQDKSIPIYGVAHCGARGTSNIGGMAKMQETWEKIAEEYIKLCQ